MNKSLGAAISAIVIAVISTAGNIYISQTAKNEGRTYQSEGRKGHSDNQIGIRNLQATIQTQQEDIKRLYIELARHNCPQRVP